MKPDNVGALMAQEDVDGGLVGGASLVAESFIRLVQAGKEVELHAMITFLTILHVIVCLFLILVVLLQAGKGGGMGIAFGGGGSQTVFGSSGAGNFLTRLTSITAVLFMLTSLVSPTTRASRTPSVCSAWPRRRRTTRRPRRIARPS